MALVLKDRIKETSSTTGTGTLTLGGAVDGFRSFADIGDGNTTYYCIADGNNFEVGIGTYTASGTTLARTTVLQTSAGNTNKITCTGNQKVFVTQPASKAAYLDASNELVVASTALSSIQQRWTKTATSNQTVFSGAADNSGATLAVNSSSHVFLNGIFLKETTDYALSGGTTVTLTAGATVNDIVEVITFTPLSSSITGISDGDIPVFTSGVADNDFLKVAGTSIEGRSASEVLSDIGGQSALTFGISSGNVPTFTSGVADNDFLKIDGTTVEGRSASEVASDIGISTYGSTLIDDADAAAARTTLGLGTIATQSSVDSNIDTHLNTSTASNNEFLQWSGSDYQWSAVDLSAYLTSSTAASTYAPLSNPTFTGTVSATEFHTPSDYKIKESSSNFVIENSSGNDLISAGHKSIPNSIPRHVKLFVDDDKEVFNTETTLNSHKKGVRIYDPDNDGGSIYLKNRSTVRPQIEHTGDYLKLGATSTANPAISIETSTIYLSKPDDMDDAHIYFGRNSRAKLHSVDNSFIALYGSGSSGNDKFIQSNHDSYTYLFHNGNATAVTNASGLTVIDSADNDDGTLYLGNDLYARLSSDRYSNIHIRNGVNEYVFFSEVNSRSYVYHDATSVLYTDIEGIYVRDVNNSVDGVVFLGTAGNARIANDDSAAVHMRNGANDYFIYGENNSYTYLYYDGAWKARATSTGFEVNGNLSVSDKIYLNNGYGSSGQVLTSRGSSSTAQWQDAAGSKWEYVNNYNFSGSNYLEIDVATGYTYRFQFQKISCSQASYLGIRFYLPNGNVENCRATFKNESQSSGSIQGSYTSSNISTARLTYESITTSSSIPWSGTMYYYQVSSAGNLYGSALFWGELIGTNWPRKNTFTGNTVSTLNPVQKIRFWEHQGNTRNWYGTIIVERTSYV